jgi:hypothetical protein
MALRDPRNKSRNNASRRTTSATRSKRATSSAKYNPNPSSSAQRSGKQGSGASKVTTGKGGKVNSPRLRQALEGVKTKRTPAKTPPKVKTNPPSSTPRGAQGPRNPDPQGPRQRVSGLQGSRTKPTTAKAPPTQKYKPRVSNVGPQIKQAKAVQKANPGRAARRARRPNVPARVAAVAGGLYTAGQILRSSGKPGAAKMSRLGIGGNAPVSKPNRKEGQKATLNGKPVIWRKGKWVPAPEQSAGKYNTRDADGTVHSRLKVGPKKVGAKKVGTAEQAFDKSYAAAKKAGKKSFTFDGKKYSTK